MCLSKWVTFFGSSVMIIMMLLDGQDQKVDAVSLSIALNRSQFFEYEPVTFYCEGVDYCDVVHEFKGKLKSCNNTNKRTSTGSSCTIKTVYTDDSGEYWSESEGGKRSNIINISVITGSAILEVPALPVMEGQTVTLHCRNKIASSNLTAHFYKDGRHIHRSSKGNMNIYRVSKSDEGLYKCSISGAGESPESWLKVTDSQNVNSTTNPDVHTEEKHSSSAASPWIIATILFSPLLVAAVGLCHFVKGCCDRGGCIVSVSSTTYVAVRKNWKKGDEDGLSSRCIYYALETQLEGAKAGTITKMTSAGIYQPIGEDPFYSAVQ